MQHVDVELKDGIALVTLHRGKVNALNDLVIKELSDAFHSIEGDPNAKAVILTGQGKFFSFGFDIPFFLSYSQDQFTRYLTDFTEFYTYLFLFPKPVVVALNGHTIAGGCMIATACDYCIMAKGKAKISLNEISFGSSVFAGSVEMLIQRVGDKNAQEVLYSGRMFSAEEAVRIGLADQAVEPEALEYRALAEAGECAGRSGPAFTSIKNLLRNPVAERMKKAEPDSIREFVDIWYSKSTWSQLQQITIRG